jgi:hypothetical protein
MASERLQGLKSSKQYCKGWMMETRTSVRAAPSRAAAAQSTQDSAKA